MQSPAHPVSRVALPDFAGVLLLGPCPGRWTPDGGEAWRQAALAEDLSTLRRLGACGLLSLVEAHELPLGAEHFASAVRDAGLDWVHLPIPDYGVPDEIFLRLWRRLALSRRLRNGENWAIHCRAGLGRTGTVAAMLLVENGRRAAEAIATIRREHDTRAVETRAQESFLSALEEPASRH